MSPEDKAYLGILGFCLAVLVVAALREWAGGRRGK